MSMSLYMVNESDNNCVRPPFQHVGLGLDLGLGVGFRVMVRVRVM